MKKPKYLFIAFLAPIFLASVWLLLYAKKTAQEVALVKINADYEKRTVIRQSTIPNAGSGLFAVTKIKEGEVIGELGGRLLSEDGYPEDNHYIASIPECAWEKTRPYKYIDSRDHSGNVSRINFAPSEINGWQTHFQNAAIRQICDHPYVIFVALKDIAPGEEIWSTYGPHYEYDKFMTVPEVRDFFCALSRIDCREEFTYAH